MKKPRAPSTRGFSAPAYRLGFSQLYGRPCLHSKHVPHQVPLPAFRFILMVLVY
jgi:hypothetical protein